ncbi:MAG: ABC transporter substrate-binding protein [Bacillota bacterium]|nr:ABC transporter substrate-binding protein [Bacillota bacterium]
MKKLLVVLLILSLLFTGCTKSSKKETETVSAPIPVSGGTVNVGIRRPDTFNPLTTQYSSCREVFNLLYDSLINLSSNFVPTGNLAAKCIYKDDGKTLEVDLRDGVKWSDGSSFTSADVLYTVNFIKEHDTSYNACLDNVVKTYSSSGNSVIFELQQPDYGFASMLVFPIIKSGFGDYEAAPVGTGGFILSNEGIKESGFALTYNQNYHLGRPYIEHVNVKYLNTDLKMESAFSSGDIDFLWDGDLSSFSEKKGIDEWVQNRSCYEFLGFNYNCQIFSDDVVRQAISKAINREELKNLTADVVITPTNAPIHPSSAIYDKQLDEEEYTQGSATELLINDGYTLSASNVFTKGGANLSFEIIVNNDNELRVRVATAVSEALSRNGISTKVVCLSNEEYKRRIEAGEYQIFIGGTIIGNMKNHTFLLGSSGKSNYFGYSGGVMDLRIEALMSAKESEEKAEGRKFLRSFTQSQPLVGLYFSDRKVLSKTGIYVAALSPSGIFKYFYSWYRY